MCAQVFSSYPRGLGAIDGFCDLADSPCFFYPLISLHTLHVAALCNVIPGEVTLYLLGTCKAPGKTGFQSILKPPRTIFPIAIKSPGKKFCSIMQGDLQPSLYLLFTLSSRNKTKTERKQISPARAKWASYGVNFCFAVAHTAVIFAFL